MCIPPPPDIKPRAPGCTCSCHTTGAVHVMPCCSGMAATLSETPFSGYLPCGCVYVQDEVSICAEHAKQFRRKDLLRREI